MRTAHLALSLIALITAVAPRVAAAFEDRIQWYATWESGRAEAARTGRPILLVSGAPHCHHVSGMW
jgi:hypothetical protein